MTLTTAQLIGTPAEGTALNENLEIGNKATSASSAIAPGRGVCLTESTGLWALPTSGQTGRMGVIPKLDPVNVDADDTLVVAIGGEWYVEFAGTVKPGQRCRPDTAGKFVAYTSGDTTATPTESTIESAIKDFERAPFVYTGHYGEGSGLGNAPTDVTSGQAGRVRVNGVPA